MLKHLVSDRLRIEICGMFKTLISLLFLVPLNVCKAQNGCKLVINEILFNPAKDGFDYVELYNNSDEAIDLSAIAIANRNSVGDISSIRLLSKTQRWLGSNGYVVVTANEKWLRQNYVVPDTTRVCTVTSLPSFPDDEGTVLLIELADSGICDEVVYNEKWHFGLVDDASGISLEKIDPALSGQNRFNWMSAASSSSYGTPGYQNSHLVNPGDSAMDLEITPPVFTPDNNGVNDMMTLRVNGAYSGYVINSTIFDISGRRVKHFLKNELLGAANIFRWDGLNDQSKRLPPAPYVITGNIFDTRGNVKNFKKVIVIATSEP